VVWFGSVDFYKIKSEPNQINVVWIGSVGVGFFMTMQIFVYNIKIKLKN